jgi:hypothetical protein
MFILITSFYGDLPFVRHISSTFLRRGSVISFSLPRRILKLYSLSPNKPLSPSLHTYLPAIRDQLPITATGQSYSSNTDPDSSRAVLCADESHKKLLQNSAKRDTKKRSLLLVLPGYSPLVFSHKTSLQKLRKFDEVQGI